MRLNPIKKRILEAMAEERQPRKPKDIAQKVGLNFSSCMMHILGLKKAGFVASPEKGYYQVTELGKQAVGPTMSKEAAAAAVKNMAKFEYGKYKYVLMAPVERATFEPHVIITYANPAQVWILLSGYLSGTGTRGGLNVTLTTGAGCQTWLTRTMQTDEAKFALVGTGERLVPNPQDYECAFSIPFSKIEQTVQGLEKGYKDGVHRYPIPGFLRYGSQHPPGYDKIRSHLLGEEP